MPPKPKYTAEDIINAAYGIARDMGIDAVSAREVAKRLSTSPSPIFTVFTSMEELKAEVWNRAMADLNERVLSAVENEVHAYRAVGKVIIDFAATEPNLFQLLFLRPELEPCGSRKAVPDVRTLGEQSVGMIVREYGLPEEDARMLFNQIWIYCVGICMMIVNRLIRPTKAEIEQMLTCQFAAVMTLIKSGKKDEILKNCREQE